MKRQAKVPRSRGSLIELRKLWKTALEQCRAWYPEEDIERPEESLGYFGPGTWTPDGVARALARAHQYQDVALPVSESLPWDEKKRLILRIIAGATPPRRPTVESAIKATNALMCFGYQVARIVLDLIADRSDEASANALAKLSLEQRANWMTRPFAIDGVRIAIRRGLPDDRNHGVTFLTQMILKSIQRSVAPTSLTWPVFRICTSANPIEWLER